MSLTENQQKEVAKITQSKGQLEASINKVEDYLSREEFEDYCDAITTCTSYMLKITKRIKGNVKQS